jgi:hypothetical protein
MSDSHQNPLSIIKSAFPIINTTEQFASARKLVKEIGLDKYHDAYPQHFSNYKIKPDSNFFAKVVNGLVKNPIVHPANVDVSHLQTDSFGVPIWHQDYVIFQNLPENDANWFTDINAKPGTASMSSFHKFIVPKFDHWASYNVLTLGFWGNKLASKSALKMLDEMETLAITYSKACGIDPKNLDLVFHCAHNSIWSLHMHILDKSHLGPSYQYNIYKHLTLASVREVLQTEI